MSLEDLKHDFFYFIYFFTQDLWRKFTDYADGGWLTLPEISDMLLYIASETNKK